MNVNVTFLILNSVTLPEVKEINTVMIVWVQTLCISGVTNEGAPRTGGIPDLRNYKMWIFMIKVI